MAQTEEKKRGEYRFIKSVQKPDGWVAMVADAAVLPGGDSGVEALRSASKTHAFNNVSLRAGVHFFTEEQLKTNIIVATSHERHDAAAQLRRALAVVEEKNGTGKPKRDFEKAAKPAAAPKESAPSLRAFS